MSQHLHADQIPSEPTRGWRAAGALILFLALAACPQLAAGAVVEVLTQHNDLNRNGATLSETVLNQSNVNANTFGKLYERAVDGQIFAQPLYVANVSIGGGVHDVVYVVTQNNAIYAFDASDGTVPAYWSITSTAATGGAATNPGTGAGLGAFVPISDITGDTNFTPNVGITSTPVIDKGTNTIYVLVMNKDAATTYTHRLRAFDIRTGVERSNSPMAITATGFDSKHQAQRPGLAMANGSIYIAFASFSDITPYSGYVLRYNAATLAKQAEFLTCPSCVGTVNNGQCGGGIWQSGCAPAIDAGGNLYVVTGNGTVDTTNASGGPATNYGESAIKLGPNLNMLDFYTPSNRDALNGGDADLGVCGQMLLPDQPFTNKRHLMIHGSKEGKLYLLNRDDMGKFNAVDQNVQTVSPYVTVSHTHATPIYWLSPTGPLIFAAPEGPGSIDSYSVSTDPAATAPLTLAKSSPATFRGTQMSLSANGSVAGSGIIWAFSPTVGDPVHVVGPGIFRAYNAETLVEIYNSTTNAARDDIGNYPKYCAPTIVNGRVYVATWSGKLCVFGLTPSPLAPSGLAATAASSSQINLAWTDNSTDEIGFEIERRPAGGTYAQLATVAAGVVAYNDSGLAGATQYFYRVRASNAGGSSAYSNEANATTQAITTVPAAPSGLAANAVSTSGIALTWTDASTNETGFKIERSPTGAGGSFVQIATVAANVTTFTDGGLAVATQYFYQVRATNAIGDSGYSNVANATTQAVGTPAAPSALSATTISAAGIVLTWTDNSGDETGFKIERGAAVGGPFTQIGTVAANIATYSDGGLAAGTQYFYRVRATNGTGDSGYSNVANATTQAAGTPTAPSTLTAVAAGTTIALAWTDNANNETGFKIERKAGSGGIFSEIAVTAADVTSYHDGALPDAAPYYYRVRATNGAGDSAYSNVATPAAASSSGSKCGGGGLFAFISLAMVVMIRRRLR